MEIQLVENGNTEVMPFIPEKRSREFETLYESLNVVNYNSLSRDNIEYQRPSILYVLPNNIEPIWDSRTIDGLEKELGMMCTSCPRQTLLTTEII